MNRQQLRTLAIALLMDDHGINEVAWDCLWGQLVDHNCTDITACIESSDNYGEIRYFLPVGWKEEDVSYPKDWYYESEIREEIGTSIINLAKEEI